MEKEYSIKVTSVVYLDIVAENEDGAIKEACATAWQIEPDECNAVVESVTELED